MKKHVLLRIVACLLLFVLLVLVACGDTQPPAGEDDPTPPAEEPTPAPGDDTPPTDDADARALEELLFYLKNVSSFPLPEDFDPTGMTPAEIVAATGDRYAAYFTKEEYDAYLSDLGGNLVGIGVSITQYLEDDIHGIHVLSVFPSSPAEAAGILPRDVIVGVDGTPVSVSGYSAALTAVAGDIGTSVTLDILRNGETFSLAVTRNTCVKETVHSRILTHGGTDIGYVYITEFDSVTSLQFVRAVERLMLAGVDSMLFDLRGNPGGYLHTVCEMLAYVLPDGDICSIDYGYDLYTDYTVYASGNTLHNISTGYLSDGSPLPVSHSLVSTPIGVLIDGGTASAAELFTSALRDYAERKLMNVTIFGANSYGKGSMQSSLSLSNGAHVKMTIALYNPPSGVNYNDVGIAPTDGYTVDTPHTSVVPRFFGTYDDIGTQDAALLLALDTLAK